MATVQLLRFAQIVDTALSRLSCHLTKLVHHLSLLWLHKHLSSTLHPMRARRGSGGGGAKMGRVIREVWKARQQEVNSRYLALRSRRLAFGDEDVCGISSGYMNLVADLLFCPIRCPQCHKYTEL